MHQLRTSGGRAARSLWSLDRTRVHLNHGSYGGITRATAEHQALLQEEMRSAPGRWFSGLPDRLEQAVGELTAILGLPPGGAVPVTNASAAATAAFAALEIPEGSVVLANSHNYGAVVHALRRAAGRQVRVEVLDVPLGATDNEVLNLYEAVLRPEVSVVLLDQFSSSTAMAFPVDDLIPLVQQSGARVVVDGAHAPGLVARPYPDPAPDVWFGNLHKHLCGPLSGGLMVMAEDLRDRAWPVIDSWNESEPYSRRFLLQGAQDVTPVLAASFAHAELEGEFGWDRIRNHAQRLTDQARTRLADAIRNVWGIDPETRVNSPSPHFALLRLPEFSPDGEDHSARLRAAMSAEARIEAMVVGWAGGHYLRLCSHAYTTLDDYEALATEGLAVLARHSAPQNHIVQGGVRC